MLRISRRLALGAFILGSIVVIAVLLVRYWWQNEQWELQLYGMASYAGSLQASADHSSETLRLYKLGKDESRAFTGENEGPFEIW